MSVDECKTKLKVLHQSRSSRRAKITRSLNKLNDLKNDNTLSNTIYERYKVDLSKSLVEVENFDDQILETLAEYDIENVDNDLFNNEIDNLSEFKDNYFSVLDCFNEFNTQSGNSGNSNNELLINALNKLSEQDSKPPPLKCGTYKGPDKGNISFDSFLNQFNAIIGCKEKYTPSLKLSYLKSYLEGFPLQLIAHLPNVDESYEEAINLLKKEFLDVAFLKDEIYKKLLVNAPTFDDTYASTRIYLSEIRSKIFELKIYNYLAIQYFLNCLQV